MPAGRAATKTVGHAARDALFHPEQHAGRPAALARSFTARGDRTVTIVVLSGMLALAAPVLVPDETLAAVLEPVGAWLTRAAATLTLPVLLSLTVVCGLHYVAAAISARAAAGVAMPFGELVAAQLAASGANRLTPFGLGGAGLVGRSFIRRGRLLPAQAVAAVSALTVLGAVADLLALAALIVLGSTLGWSGAAGEIPLLLGRIRALVPVPGGGAAWAAGGLTVGVLLAGAALLRGRRRATQLRAAAAGYRSSLTLLARAPGRLLTLVTASAATTMLLAAGFATTATLGPAGLPVRSFAAIMIGFMLASAAGNAVPTPGAIGAAEAALTGCLVAVGVSVGSALATVLAFRLVTFWAPAVAGALLIQPLRRRGAL